MEFKVLTIRWLGGHIMIKNDHIPPQHHNHTNLTTTKFIQLLNSYGHFDHPGHYNAHPERG